MAAYAALVSLRHIIEQIEHHPRPPISLDKKQVQSLTQKVKFLQDFFERYSINGGSEDIDALEGRTADAAYLAEDIIESNIVDQILAGSTSHWENISSTDLYQGLHKVIQDMDLIKREVTTEIKEKKEIQDQLLRRNSMPASSLRPPSTGQNTMVGFDDVLIEIMDKLTGQQCNRQIIPIVGMGGIGKTTLARNIYLNPVIKHHFDFRGWVTISQEYNIREILLQVLLCVATKESKENLRQMSGDELGEKLYKSLSGKRYLIILDDVWGIEAWDKVNCFFPDNSSGSRIMITTRLQNLASQLNDSYVLKMNFLDNDKCWNLLCQNVFGEESCPLELEEIGKKIAKNCRGLPLSIVVIGGFVAKSQRTRENWKHIAKNLTSIVSSEDNEHCLKILHMSYNQLTVHLKPCFLYMGVFPEDAKIRVSSLIKLWVAEGFLKPISGKSLEMVAEEYLKDLIHRNLILVDKLGSSGKIKTCKIHDLLRDLCIREGQKEKFLHVTSPRNISQSVNTQRRISIYLQARGWKSVSLARSLIGEIVTHLPFFDFRLLRVWNVVDISYKLNLFGDLNYTYYQQAFQLVNLRYLTIQLTWYKVASIPSSVHLLWNLQTLTVKFFESSLITRGIRRPDFLVVTAPFDIWKMTGQLRHVKFDKLELPDPPSYHMDGQDDFVLGNLQTLSKLRNFKCSEEVVKRIPNIKKLHITYDISEESLSSFCLNNLGQLHKLESLRCIFFLRNKPSWSYLQENLTFPHSLKKLTLRGSHLNWEDMITKIGSLPHLQVLKLKCASFNGPEWETVEGQFCCLKFLLIEDCHDLEYWTTDSTHFPRLERLVLRRLQKLNEVPLGIGEIPTLQSIELSHCSDSSVISAKKILEEQEELGNVGLQVRAQIIRSSEGMQRLASDNFHVAFLFK